jgi:alpha-L-fucosidase
MSKCLLIRFCWLYVAVAASVAAETPKETEARLAWWREARCGLFIHWGPVSLKGTEIGWSRGREIPVAEYDQLYRQFNPTNFSARAWVSLAQNAGMKYIVLTSKHHDGFCLWDSKQTGYDIMATPLGRDVIKELSEECRRQGLVFCLYYSIADWHHPDYVPRGAGDTRPERGAHFDWYVGYLHAQLHELLANYGPIGILWFDGEWERTWTHAYAVELDQYLRRLQPTLIINNRIDKGRHNMEGATAPGDFVGDYDTPEQQVGRFQNSRPWESCITLCQQWAWKPGDDMKSFKEVLRTFITCAGGDGNLLLNVGPMPTGEIEPRQAARLKELGDWLRCYGQSIYGTRGGPFKPGPWGASTVRGDRVYLHLFDWPAGDLVLPSLPQRILAWRTLAGGRAELEQDHDHIRIRVPPADRGDVVTTLELKLAGRVRNVLPSH